MEIALVALMILPGTTSFGLAWLLLFIFMRAWTVRSTRQGYTEEMNHIIYEPHHQMQVLLFSIPWDGAIAWVLAHVSRLHREPVLGVATMARKRKKSKKCERWERLVRRSLSPLGTIRKISILEYVARPLLRE